MAKATFNLQLQGYTPANRDAQVTLVNQATGQKVERKPFLDGSLMVRDLDPGLWQVQVKHPNLALPIFDKPIRLFPQPQPTRVPIPINPVVFTDAPVRDIPDANLGPVQQSLTATRDAVAAIGAKAPGEVIRASDFNVLAQAAVDLANSMLEVTNLVSPRGHNHPEIEERIDQVSSNLRNFAESYGKSLLEIRRDMEADDVGGLVDNTLGAVEIDPEVLKRIRDRVGTLKDLSQTDTPAYTGKLATLGTSIITELNNAAVAQGENAEAFRSKPEVRALLAKAEQYSTAGTQLRPENEIQVYRNSKAAARTATAFVKR